MGGGGGDTNGSKRERIEQRGEEVTPECSWEAEQGLERRQGWKEVGTWGDGDAHGTGRERRGAVAGPLSSASILRKKEL